MLSHDEAIGIIAKLASPYRLLASLMYGSGLRVTEACRLRVKDIDFNNQIIIVRDGKGAKDRTTLMPGSLISELERHIASIRKAWKEKQLCFQTPVSVPFAFDRKNPGADMSLDWRWLITSSRLSKTDMGKIVRHHIHTSSVQKAVKRRLLTPALANPQAATPSGIPSQRNC